MGCNQNFAGAGGVPKAQCPDCPGMPRWWVSEPYISLCMADTPLSYMMSSGKEMDFELLYHQRARLPESDESPITSQDYEINAYYADGPNCGTDAFWGNNWNMSVVIEARGYMATPVFSKGYYALVFNPQGGIDNYTNLNFTNIVCQNPQSKVILTDVSGLSYPKVAENLNGFPYKYTNVADAKGVYWNNAGVGVKLLHPDGSQEIFGLSARQVKIGDVYERPAYTNFPPLVRLLLTQRIDPQGRIINLGYERFDAPNSFYQTIYRLKYVVDSDNRTNLFRYTATNNVQLAEIDDPYGRKTTIGYTGGGLMSQITDAIGLTNYFSYQANLAIITITNYCVDSFGYETPCGSNTAVSATSPGWITQLTTKYGTNKFSHYEVADSSLTDGVVRRAIYASEPTGAQQLYYYLHNAGANVPTSDTAPNVPGQTNFDNGTAGGASGGHNTLVYRNTFHWGRRQFEAITNTYVQSNLAESTITTGTSSAGYFAAGLAYLSSADYAKAGMKHWLLAGSDTNSITEGLSSERAPSFDAAGQVPGARTWYNYANKPDNGAEELGNFPQVTCVAAVLPDGTSQYTTYNYYQLSNPTNTVGLVSDNESTYTKPDGTISALTNWFTYAGNNVDLLSISNSTGQYVNYGYNTNHQIKTVTNALSQVTTLTWDASTFNLTGVQMPAGKSIGLSYYAPAVPPTSTSAMLQQITNSPEGRTFTINNYSAGLPSNITDDRGLTVANTWDGLNRLTGTVFPDNTSISNIYYRLDLVATKDRLTNWTYFAYDGLQHLITVTNANNVVTTYSWCGCGSLESIIDCYTNSTSFNYDNQGNLTYVSYPDTSSLTYQFDSLARMTNAFDGANRYMQLAYNVQGLPTNIASANGTLQSATYDSLNRPIRVTDANGVTVTNQYDAINELLKHTWPGGISEGYGYSAAGLIAYTNRDQMPTMYGRDGAGRLTSVTNANQEVTQFGYDSLNNMISLIDGLKHTNIWQYNEYGWLTNKVDGLKRNAFRYAYNANGWVTNRWTPEKGNTGYAFDNIGNLKTIVYPQQTNSYAYDALNRLTNMVDAVGTTAFSYTPAGQLQSENGPWTSDTLAYTYVQGLRTVLSLTQPGGTWSQGYGYDSGWRLQNLTSPAGNFNYSYNFKPASALVSGISLPNGANITNGYDGLARLTQTTLNNYWGHPLDSYAYIPDALGLRTNIVRNLGLTTNNVNVGYDAIGQITSWIGKESGGALRQNEQLGWAYDAAHNLHTRNNGNLAQTFTTDAANQLNSVTRLGNFTMTGATPAPATSVTVNGLAAQIYGDFTFARTNNSLNDGTNTFTIIATNIYNARATNILTLNLPQSAGLNFDNNGSLTNDGTRTFAFDAENQLTNVTVASRFKKDFVYDGLNRLRIKREFGWTNSAWLQTNEVHFIYDGNLIIQHRNSNNVPTLTLTRGLDLSGSLQGAGGIGGLLAMTESSGANSYYHSDASGNITALMDASENIVARRAYDVFGRTIFFGGTKAGVNLYWFSSQLHDEDTDLYHYEHRPYAPNLQRWLSQDPLGEASGINLYDAFFNSPTRYVDRSGRDNWANMSAGNNAPVAMNIVISTIYSPLPQFNPSGTPQLAAANPNVSPYVPAQPVANDGLVLGSDMNPNSNLAQQFSQDFQAPLYSSLLSLPKAVVKCPIAAGSARFEGLTGDQVAKVQSALTKAGLADANILIKGADMPANYFGMTLGDEGFAINRYWIDNEEELLNTLQHEYQHVLDRRALGDSGAYGNALEEAARAAEKH